MHLQGHGESGISHRAGDRGRSGQRDRLHHPRAAGRAPDRQLRQPRIVRAARTLLVWQRIVCPDGASIRLDNTPATDPAGYSGASPLGRMMAQLRLQRLPGRTPLKITITVPPELHRALEGYAAIYAETYGDIEPLAELILAMLAAFVESDCEFARQRKPGSSRGLARE